MKSSIGVTICAVVVLIASTLALVGAGGAAFMVLGPLRGQLFDPANLPPGADVGMMRAMMLSGVAMGAAFAGLGIATGIGLIRLWKWARFSAIAIGVFIIIFSVLPGILFAFAPIPLPASSTNGQVPIGFRMFLVSFYLVWAACAGLFVYMMMRKSTVAQFNGEATTSGPRKRPLSVTIIAWLMLVSGLLMLPMVFWGNLPGMFLGMVFTGMTAKIFYVVYMLVYVTIGLGLIKRTRATLGPAIVVHSLALFNALLMFVPPVWTRYQAAIAATVKAFGTQPTASTTGSYFGLFFGAAFAAIILFFLLRARRTLAVAHQ